MNIAGMRVVEWLIAFPASNALLPGMVIHHHRVFNRCLFVPSEWQPWYLPGIPRDGTRRWKRRRFGNRFLLHHVHAHRSNTDLEIPLALPIRSNYLTISALSTPEFLLY
jgi:hypothetical protein